MYLEHSHVNIGSIMVRLDRLCVCLKTIDILALTTFLFQVIVVGTVCGHTTYGLLALLPSTVACHASKIRPLHRAVRVFPLRDIAVCCACMIAARASVSRRCSSSSSRSEKKKEGFGQKKASLPITAALIHQTYT